jgi:hypothetical protein
MNGQSGIKTTLNSTEGMILTSISDGDYIRLKGVDFGTAGAASISVRAASAANGGRIELRTGSSTGTLIGTVNIASTGNWNTWQTFTADVTNSTGVKDYLYLVFKGTGEPFRLSWYQFNGADGEGSKIDVTCNVNNLASSYVVGSSVPRPNVSCGEGISVGTASFIAGSSAVEGWSSPDGTNQLYNEGTRTVTLNSIECGDSNITLDPPLTCGILEIVPEITPIISRGVLTNVPALVEVYDLKGHKVDVKSPLPSGIYIAKMRGTQGKIFVVK